MQHLLVMMVRPLEMAAWIEAAVGAIEVGRAHTDRDERYGGEQLHLSVRMPGYLFLM